MVSSRVKKIIRWFAFAVGPDRPAELRSSGLYMPDSNAEAQVKYSSKHGQ